MSTPQEISELIDRFDRNREAYLSGQYNETQLRREFLDPLFMSLGWDVDNKQGYAEAYKDVIHGNYRQPRQTMKRHPFSDRLTQPTSRLTSWFMSCMGCGGGDKDCGESLLLNISLTAMYV